MRAPGRGSNHMCVSWATTYMCAVPRAPGWGYYLHVHSATRARVGLLTERVCARPGRATDYACREAQEGKREDRERIGGGAGTLT